MKNPKILLVYKMSAYDYYRRVKRLSPAAIRIHQKRFADTHQRHYQTLHEVESFLKSNKIRYRRIWRGRMRDYASYDMVITVGGDGTFLEAARYVEDQPIIGINSDPRWSIGHYCAADSHNFSSGLTAVFKNRYRINRLQRLCLAVADQKKQVRILNDILICNRVPAAMSRYRLRIGRRNEEQRGSGLWIATAAGSTGAIYSAGGRRLPWTSRRWQYLPRELNAFFRREYRLGGGIMGPGQSLKLTSLMKDGMIYMDGAHYKKTLPMGATVTVMPDRLPLNQIIF